MKTDVLAYLKTKAAEITIRNARIVLHGAEAYLETAESNYGEGENVNEIKSFGATLMRLVQDLREIERGLENFTYKQGPPAIGQ